MHHCCFCTESIPRYSCARALHMLASLRSKKMRDEFHLDQRLSATRHASRITNHHSRLTDHWSLAVRHARTLIANQNLLEKELTPSLPIPNAFLIATICPTFFSAPLLAHHLSLITCHSPLTTRHCISNRYSRRLEIPLTLSQQTRKHFLIGTI